MVVGGGIEVQESALVGIVDVFRYGEGELERSVYHIVLSHEESLCAVVKNEGFFRSVAAALVESAGDGLLGVAHGGCQHAVEVGLVHNVAFERGNAAGF